MVAYDRIMTLTLDGRDDLSLPMIRLIRTAIDTGDGGTPQQRGMLIEIARLVFGIELADVSQLQPMHTHEAAMFFDTAALRRRAQMFLVIFSLCRHPLTEEQVVLVDSFIAALEGDQDDPGLIQARAMVESQMLQISDDLLRAWGEAVSSMTENTLKDDYGATEIAAPELVERVRALGDLPRGTLGREYVEFYRANGFSLPGEEAGVPAFFVGHDMCHLIAGCGPKAHEEIALGAFLLGARDTEQNWAYLLGVLAIFEFGSYAPTNFVSKVGTLAREGSMEVVLDALVRGQRCYVDLTAVDHLAMAHLAISDIRQRFNIASPNPPFPEFIDIVRE